jgi:hypothetical protein
VHEARPKCNLDFVNALALRLHGVKKINAMFREWGFTFLKAR